MPRWSGGGKRQHSSLSSSNETESGDHLQHLIKLLFNCNIAYCPDLPLSTLCHAIYPQPLTSTKYDEMSISVWCTKLLTCSVKKGNTTMDILNNFNMSLRHRICGHTFGTDEIAFSCRDCRTDPSCVMCKQCFTHRYVKNEY